MNVRFGGKSGRSKPGDLTEWPVWSYVKVNPCACHIEVELLLASKDIKKSGTDIETYLGGKSVLPNTIAVTPTMADRDKSIKALCDQLIGLLSDWDAEFSVEWQRKDEEVAQLKSEKAKNEKRIADLVEQLDNYRQASKKVAGDLDVSAELEINKALIDGLRYIQRPESLEASLREKDDMVAMLEASVKRYAETLIALNHSTDAWKKKYAALTATKLDLDSTTTRLQALEDDTESPDQWVEELFQSVGSHPEVH